MAKQGFFSEHWTDEEGRPTGGITSGRGFVMSWQNGPLGIGNDRKEPNGAFVEDVIEAVIERIGMYQKSQFKCDENARALVYLEAAVGALNERTKRREDAGTEGTWEGK